MQWLIIYQDNNKSLLQNFTNLLQKYDINATIFLTSEINNLQIEKINNSIKNVTHCILLDKTNFDEQKDVDISFVLGAITSKVSKLFSLNNSHTKKMKFFKNFYSFDNDNELFTYLENNLTQIIHEETSKQAFYDLFNDGIPFTADCFASHVAKDDRAICERFLIAGIDVNCRTTEGVPILNIAIRNEQVEEVKWLLNYNPDINAISNDRGYSAIMDAVWINNFELTKLLIEKNPDLNCIGFDGQNVLVLAVGIGNYSICKLLAENGASPDVKDKMGMSAFEYAKLFNKKEIVDVLSKYHTE